MDKKNYKASINVLVPIMLEYFENDLPFRLYHRGTSMNPTLIEGIDSVLLARPAVIRKYDIVLYRRDNGQIVLHRIVGKNKSGYILCGDNQLDFEYGIRYDQILAKVIKIFKEDTPVAVDSNHIREINKLYKKKILLRIKRSVKKLFKR